MGKGQTLQAKREEESLWQVPQTEKEPRRGARIRPQIHQRKPRFREWLKMEEEE